MKYVLDTSSVSVLLKADPRAVRRLKAAERSSVAIPQPVIAEISFGLERLPGSTRKSRLQERWTLFKRYLPRVEWTDEVSRQFGIIKASLQRKGTIIEDFHIAIAAHALAHEAVLVSTDTSHMSRIRELQLEDWTAE